MPNLNPIEVLEQELDAYELEAQHYSVSSNHQRTIQLIIARGIIAKCKANLVSLEQAKALLYALKESMPFEYTSYLGHGSKLKKILTKFTAIARIPTPYFKHFDSRATPTIAIIGSNTTPTQIAANAYRQKLAHIKLQTETHATDPYALPTTAYSDLITDIELDVAHLAQCSDISMRFDVSQIDDSASDAFLPDFKTIPFGLLHHAKELYALVTENLPAAQKTEARKHIFARLPTHIHKDFEDFLAGRLSFNDEIKTDRELAHEYLDERLSPESNPSLLALTIAQQKIKKAQLANILTAIFILNAQFNSENSKAIISDKTYTNFENLMGYIVGIASVINLEEHPELRRDRAKLITEYTEMREQGSTIVAQIIDILLKNGYLISAELTTPIDTIALLKRIYQEPDSTMKRKIFQQLNQKRNGISLLEQLSNYATIAARIKNEAGGITHTAINISRNQEAARRSAAELDHLAHEKIILAAQNHFHAILIKNARKVYLKYWDQANRTLGPLHSEPEKRLWTEWQTLSEVIPESIIEFDLAWREIISITSAPALPISTHVAGDETCLTVDYQLEAKHLEVKLKRPITLAKINELLTTTIHPEVKRNLLSAFNKGIMIDGVEIAKFEERLTSTTEETPAAIKYKLDCSLSLCTTEPAEDLDSATHSEEAYDTLFTQIIELNQIFKDILKIINDSHASIETVTRNVETAHSTTHEGVIHLASLHHADIQVIRDMVALQEKAITSGKVDNPFFRSDKVTEALRALNLEETYHSSLPKARKNAAAKKALIALLIETIENCYRRYGGENPSKKAAAQITLNKKFKDIAEITFVGDNPKIKFNAELFKLNLIDCYNTIIKLLNNNRNSLAFFSLWTDCATVQFIKNKLQQQGLTDPEYGELYHLENGALLATPSTTSTLATITTPRKDAPVVTTAPLPITVTPAPEPPEPESLPTRTFTEALEITLPDRMASAIVWLADTIFGTSRVMTRSG